MTPVHMPAAASARMAGPDSRRVWRSAPRQPEFPATGGPKRQGQRWNGSSPGLGGGGPAKRQRRLWRRRRERTRSWRLRRREWREQHLQRLRRWRRWPWRSDLQSSRARQHHQLDHRRERGTRRLRVVLQHCGKRLRRRHFQSERLDPARQRHDREQSVGAPTGRATAAAPTVTRSTTSPIRSGTPRIRRRRTPRSGWGTPSWRGRPPRARHRQSDLPRMTLRGRIGRRETHSRHLGRDERRPVLDPEPRFVFRLGGRGYVDVGVIAKGSATRRPARQRRLEQHDGDRSRQSRRGMGRRSSSVMSNTINAVRSTRAAPPAALMPARTKFKTTRSIRRWHAWRTSTRSRSSSCRSRRLAPF